MSITVPLSYLRYQGPNIYGMFSEGLRSALPRRGKQSVDTPTEPVQRQIPAVPERLVAAYAEWTGAPPERYADVLPPHMFSYWGMAMIAGLTGQAPYNLLSVLNQGCRIQNRQPLPIGETIEALGHLASIDNDGRRIRIASHLHAHTLSAPLGQSMDIMTAVPLKNAAGKKPRKNPEDEPAFETIGTWSASAQDGVNFALLTGDFNPIHVLGPVARRTRYKGCILHGFGFLSRTYETILNAGMSIRDFDIRYVKPLPLPTDEMQVQISREPVEGRTHALRLCSPDGTLHLVGHFSDRIST